MIKPERIAIRQRRLAFIVVTVVAVSASDRGYAIEAHTPAGTLVAAVRVQGQSVALRLARIAGRAADADNALQLITAAAPSAAASSFTMAAAGGVQ